MDKFEQKEMKKKRPVKDTWQDCLINYTSEPIRKSESDFKDQVVSIFKTNIPKQTMYGRGKKLSKPKTQKQSVENIIKSIKYFFYFKKRK